MTQAEFEFIVLTPKAHIVRGIHCVHRQQRGVTQFGRVLGLGPRCRRFNSCRPDHLSVINDNERY